jgi:hypothetical protein
VHGDPIFPEEDEFFEINSQTILHRFSEADAFDVPITFENKDKFVVRINATKWEKIKEYTYEYIIDQWVISELDFFELENDFDQVNFGKLKSFRKKME